MPLFVAAVVAAHRSGRTSTITVPVNAPPLWVMVMDETFTAIRALASRLRHRKAAAGDPQSLPPGERRHLT